VIPWEEPGRPWWPRLTDTVRLLFTSPRAAFERMPLDSDMLKPFVFALIVGSFGAICNLAWDALVRILWHGMSQFGPQGMRYGLPLLFVPFAMLFSPLGVALGIVVGAAIDHLFLLIVGGGKSGFGATLRVACYSQAAQVLQLFPLCGGLLAVAACIVFAVVGFSAAHRISIGRAGFAVALPLLLCCACLLILAVTVGSALMAKFGSGMTHP
jgi:hypothetical protein